MVPLHKEAVNKKLTEATDYCNPRDTCSSLTEGTIADRSVARLEKGVSENIQPYSTGGS